MITVLTGENDFEIARATGGIMAGFGGEAEIIEGSGLQLGGLSDLLLGATLFSEHRLIIIKNLADNKTVWTALADLVPKVPEDTHLVLVEPKPDKRTTTYKTLQKQADVKEYKLWGERETAAAEHWASQEAERMGLGLKNGAARLIVSRSMAVSEKGAFIDQWRLRSNLEKLAPLGEVGQAEVEQYVDETPVENVFGLLETALKGDTARLREMIRRLEASEDPFRLFGLLGGQVFWLAVLSATDKPSGVVAKEIGAHPYVLGKLASYAKHLGPAGAKTVVRAFAEADNRMKTSAAEPWLLIERALVKVAANYHR